jgi:2-oxoisovalerate dehydrogenase E2 component (dihydrolipoyl transacylase)
MADPTVFTLPDLGEGLQEAEIVAWMVGEGDHVVADQPLVSVETDKAVVEIPSPRAGRIARLIVATHDHVPVGAPLLEFAADGAEPDTGTVVGALPPIAPSSAAPPSATLVPPRNSGPRMAPAVRALARKLGVDPTTITPTGPEASITRADIERAAAAPPSSSSAEPLRGVRRAMALRMAEAGTSVVPATLTDEADVQSWPQGTDVTTRLVQALVAACAAEPALNVAFDGKAMSRRPEAGVHVGIAVDTADGLFVPVLHDAHLLDPAAIRTTLATMKGAVAARSARPDELRGASITLSNFGALGGRFAALVVIPPQVAILGAGRIYPRVIPSGDRFATHRTLPLSLSFDHRVVTGGEAARFMGAVIRALESAG